MTSIVRAATFPDRRGRRGRRAMPAAAWLTRKVIGAPWGSWMFFATLVVATISVTLRLNLWFITRVHVDVLADHRARVFSAIAASELVLIFVLSAAAVFVGTTREVFATPIVVVASTSFASLTAIEPVATRAAGLTQ